MKTRVHFTKTDMINAHINYKCKSHFLEKEIKEKNAIAIQLAGDGGTKTFVELRKKSQE